MSPSVEPHPTGPGQHTVARGDEQPADDLQPAPGAQVRSVLPASRRLRRTGGGCLPRPSGDGLRDAGRPRPGRRALGLPAPPGRLRRGRHLPAAVGGPGVHHGHHDRRGACPAGRRRCRHVRHHGRVHGTPGRADVPAGRHPATGDRGLPAEQAGADRLPRRRRGHHDRRPARQAVRDHRLRRHAPDPDLVGPRPARQREPRLGSDRAVGGRRAVHRVEPMAAGALAPDRRPRCDPGNGVVRPRAVRRPGRGPGPRGSSPTEHPDRSGPLPHPPRAGRRYRRGRVHRQRADCAGVRRTGRGDRRRRRAARPGHGQHRHRTDIGLPGVQQRLAHCPGQGVGRPDPRLRPGHGAVRRLRPDVRRSAAGRLPQTRPRRPRGVRRVQDRGVRRVPLAVELPTQRVLAGDRRVRRSPHPRPARWCGVRHPAVRHGHAGPRRPPTRRGARPGPGPGGDA